MTLPLIVDSFAGGGGASTGIEMALGRSPDIAINHNPAALALHEANHPQTLHLSENVYKIDPLDYLRGAHVGLAWFSPDCKHFSKAKGGKPVERNIRDLAWIIPGWIERIQKSGGKVDVVCLENVEEFQDYGPLIETERGLMPDPRRKGEYFKKWCRKIRTLGGKIEWRELRACDLAHLQFANASLQSYVLMGSPSSGQCRRMVPQLTETLYQGASFLGVPLRKLSTGRCPALPSSIQAQRS